MKEKTNLINANTNNLISLWKTVGNSFEAYSITPNFEYCEIIDSEWPNRLWLHESITKETIGAIRRKISASTSKITLPIWNFSNKNQENLLAQHDFKLKFEQVGMSLKLDKPFEHNGTLQIICVKENEEAKIWSELFLKSFKYRISTETIEKTCNEINYYIAYHNDIAVGTAIIHKTEDILGIHAVGIPPEMRRRGYAAEIMKLLLNSAIASKNKYVTLQASEMGKNIYLKLGFQSQFSIKNYIL